jgi:hypothetical protein
MKGDVSFTWFGFDTFTTDGLMNRFGNAGIVTLPCLAFSSWL